jgi:hypothetical protein
LQERNCTVPQPTRGPANVIQGEFFKAGERGWAVVCHFGLLAFRNDRDTNPVMIAAGTTTYPRRVSVATPIEMRRYQRLYGSQDLPFDHQGIDDAFEEKASHIWYLHDGVWLALPAAD